MSGPRAVANGLSLRVIDRDSAHYAETVTLRYDIFYKDSQLSLNAVQDELESRSQHLVALRDGHVVGYIRLTVDGNIGRLSQFLVVPEMRRKGHVARLLYRRIVECARDSGVERLVGEIRLPLAPAARHAGFFVSDEAVPSKKTGIPHLRIELRLAEGAAQ